MSILSALTSAITDADSYKVAHWSQYPEGTEFVSSYIEPRSSKYAKTLGDKYNFAEFFGLQAYLKDHLSKPVTQDDVDLGEILFRMHGEPFHKEGWQYIVDHHGGKLPVEIRAVPEGTVLPTSNALVEIVNTDPKCFWLTSYVETALLRAVWYPTTVATKSRLIKEICREFLDRTSDLPAAADNVVWDLRPAAPLNFMLHDFGARGNSSSESSMLAGMAHIVNFLGTDTVMGIIGALRHYEPEFETLLKETPDNPTRAMISLLQKMEKEGKPLPAFSVEASEHSTMTIKGRDGEKEQIKALIDKAKQGRIVSIVSDSYDYFNNVINVYGGEFKKDILEAGAKGGRVVIRPDSGDPVEVITKTLELLAEKFKDECVINSKGKIVLPPCVRVLQGDGIDLDTLRDILAAVEKKGFSAENVVFGMGGGLEQKVTRDDLNFAQKASAARIKGVWHDVHKDPVTADPKFIKKSKKGRLSTVWDGVAFATRRTMDLLTGQKDRMVTVFLNGELKNTQTFAEIRARAEYFTHLMLHAPEAPIADPWEQVKKPAARPAAPGA